MKRLLALALLLTLAVPITTENMPSKWITRWMRRAYLWGRYSRKYRLRHEEVNVISDSSNGIFSRHINKRLSNICYKKTDKFDVVYRFEPAKVLSKT
jgi:hypothetical protein